FVIHFQVGWMIFSFTQSASFPADSLIQSHALPRCSTLQFHAVLVDSQLFSSSLYAAKPIKPIAPSPSLTAISKLVTANLAPRSSAFVAKTAARSSTL